jgi:hypothetical protein
MRAITAAALALLGFGLSGCAAFDVASGAVDVTTTVVGAAASTAGDVIGAPFAHADTNKERR